jgi:Flp pilus assembly protein TadD
MSMNILPVALLLVASKLWAGAAEAETNKLSPQTAFKKAASLMERGQHKEAIPYLEQVQKEYPDNASVLWNLGIAQAETGNHNEAVKVWQRYRKIAPNEWQAVAKIVQAYQGI